MRCMGCMEEYDDSLSVCPICGYARNTQPAEAYHLEPETILNGKYIIGKVLGFGGFGTTYIGWDLMLEKKVAIKEYMPSDFATRVPGETKLSVYDGELGEQFEAGLKSFIDESQRLAKFNNEDGIVHIYDSFLENSTAYIVMEYLEGKTLKAILKERGGKISYSEAVTLIEPVLKSLDAVHKTGIIHRDIAPDNIFITDDGRVKLIDFGASRYATTLHSKSLSVILKQGFAPEEQYRSRGNQGPWSDVYAVCATLYNAITGIVPEDALERCEDDTLVPPSKLGIEIPQNVENAILNGLNVRAENRIQSAGELAQALTGETDVQRVVEKKVRSDVGKWSKKQISFAIGSVAAVILVVCLAMFGVFDMGSLDTDIYTTIPDYIGLTIDEAQSKWEEYCKTEGVQNVSLVISDGVTQDSISGYTVNQIYAVKPSAGQWFKKISDEESYIYVTVVLPSLKESIEENKGKDTWTLQNYANYKLADVKNIISSMSGVNVKVVELPSEKSKGVVIQTVPGAGSQVKKGDTVTVYVSDGSLVKEVDTVTKDEIKEEQNNKPENKPENRPENPGGENNPAPPTTTKPVDTRVTVPNVVNAYSQSGTSALVREGLKPQIEFCYSNTYGEDKIAKQSINSGTKVEKGTKITVWISAGKASDAWSSWSTSRPSSNYEIRTQTQYRYRTRDTYQEAVYGSWGATQWYTSQQSTSDTVQYMGSRQVETQKHYKTQYRYSHWTNGSRSFPTWTNGASQHFTDWSDNRKIARGTLSWQGGSYTRYGDTSSVWGYCGSCGRSYFPWYNEETRQVYTYSDYRTEYGYQKRSKSYETKYTAWGSWSSWSTTSTSSSSTRDVETRTVYSYREKLPTYN